MRIIAASLAVALATALAGCQTQPVIRIDGQFDDWAGVTPAATDPAGDATGAFDLTSVSATSHGTEVFLSWDSNADVNIQAGDQADGTLQTTLTFESGGTLTIDFRARIAYRNGDRADLVAWPAINYTTLPTVALPRYETRIDVREFAAAGDVVSIQFHGSDTLDTGPITITLDQPPIRHADRSHARLPGTSFRILNYNTLRDGLTNEGQRDQIGRTLAAFDPDIIFLQEENRSTAESVTARLEEIDPTGDGRPWYVKKQADCVIATQHTLVPFDSPIERERFAAAVVNIEGAGPVFVIGLHTKCCGNAGSSEDARRIAEMVRIIEVIDLFNAGDLSEPLASYAGAPVIITGDWNHVGSDEPLAVMLDPEGPALAHWLIEHLSTNDITTWRELNGLGFMPGLLDLVVYDPIGLEPRNGFVVNTGELGDATLADLGLEHNDSNASDHLAVVADFAIVD